MVEKRIIFALMVISILFVSACDIYDALYVKQQGNKEGTEKVSDDKITIEGKTNAEKDMSKENVPSNASVIIVQETDLVNLVPKAEDPDKDKLTFAFTSPVDANGQWQTKYGDAGEYTITATASDGQLTATKEVLIIVKKKEEAPAIDSFKPEQTAIQIDETNTVLFQIKSSDLNKDSLKHSWKLDGVEVSDKDSMEYKTTYEDSGSHTVKVTVSDGTLETEKIWSVTVNNLNRKPQLAKIADIKAKETDIITIKAEALDDDNDALTYSIDNSMFVQDGNTFTWKTGYDDSGEHTATVSVSDGKDTINQTIRISIENVNRAPVILDIVQKK